MPTKIAMRFQLIGDSLTSGMAFSLNGTWFDFDRHKGSERVGLEHIFTDQANTFIHKFNKKLAKSTHLNHLKVYLTPNVFARGNLSIAHHNPSVSTQFVPHQMHAPSINTLNDVQSDSLFIALGINDTQDFNTLTVETMIQLFQNNKYYLFKFIDMVRNHHKNPDLANKIFSGYKQLVNSFSFVNLTPNHRISKTENLICLAALKAVLRSTPFIFDKTLLQYSEDWEKKQYWSKSTDEIIATLDHLLTDYEKNQCIDKRGYGLTVTLILPPTLSKPCIFPAYHQTQQHIIELREALIAYAKRKGLATIDMDVPCQQVDKMHGDDHLHLTEEAYNEIEKQTIFDEAFKMAIRSRLSSFIKSPDALKELDIILSGLASLTNQDKLPSLSGVKASLFQEECDHHESGIPAITTKNAQKVGF